MDTKRHCVRPHGNYCDDKASPLKPLDRDVYQGAAGALLPLHRPRLCGPAALCARPPDGTCSRTWLLRIKWRDEELRLALGTSPETTLEAARAEARRLRELASQGLDPRTVRSRRTPRPAPLPGGAALAPENQHSVDFLVSEFIERHLRPRRKRPEWAEQILAKHVLPEWSGRDARAIKPREVIALLDGIVASGRRVMANRCASLLGQMFKFGIHRQIVELSPVQLLFQPGGEEKSRDRVLEDAELAVLLKNGARYARLSHVVTLLLLTGARRGELAAARWADVDLAERVWTIPPENSKTGVAMLVPLTDWAVREFEALKKLAKRSPWVLPGTDASQHLEPRLLTRGVERTSRASSSSASPDSVCTTCAERSARDSRA